MSTAQKIRDKISSLDEGTTFTYDQMGIENEEYPAAAKAIERMISQEEITRISKGFFYKPEKSIFGDLKPNEEQLVKPYMYEGNRRIAYITGLSLYNRMGLTTQVPNSITLACNKKRINTEINNLKIKTVKSYVEPEEENIRFLEILDAVKDFKKIPDMDIEGAVTLLQNRIGELDEDGRKRLVNYAVQYPPRVRALLGALLSDQQLNSTLSRLKRSLNPLTKYNFGTVTNRLPNAQNWNIA